MLRWVAILTVVLSVAQAAIPTARQTATQHRNKGTDQQPSKQDSYGPSNTAPKTQEQQESSGNQKSKTQERPQPDQQTTINITNSAPMPGSLTWRDILTVGGNLVLDLVGIVGTIIALWSVCTLKRQTKASWAAAKAALKQANHIVTSERAWVEISRITLTSGAIDQPGGGKQLFVSCEGINRGKTPARVLGLNVLLAVGPIADPEKTWNENLYDFSGMPTPRWNIVPGIPKPLYRAIRGFVLNPGEELPTLDAGDAHFIHGVLRYWDVFSQLDRFTRFCYREDRGGSLLGKGWHVAGEDRCNQET
jgi:hypothetical protein